MVALCREYITEVGNAVIAAAPAKTTDGVYEGERNEAGEREGRGKYTFADGDVYEGEYKNGKKEGRGKFTFASGDVYEGEYKNDKKEGRGKYTFADGRVGHDGMWRDGQPA